MDLEELYENIFDLEGVPQRPPFHGFSYGVLIVEDGRPLFCLYVDDRTDQKLQYIFTHGMIEFYAVSRHQTEIFYGYVTDGAYFYCEEQIYPQVNTRESGLL